MNWIEILWPMMGAASLTLGGIHFLIWFRGRNLPSQLLFSLASGSVAVCAVFEVLMMRAATPAQYSALLRWSHVPIVLLIVSLVGFVYLHFRSSRLWLGLAICALRASCLLPNFLTGVNLNFESITVLDRINVWGGDVIALPIGEPNPWMLLGQLSNLLMVLFLLDTIVTVWGRGNAGERRRAVLVCGSMVVFMLLASVWTALVVLGRVSGPLTINIAFLFVIITMSYELGGEVIRATQIARRLADSESSLRDSEQRLHLAAHAAKIGLWTWDVDSKESWITETGNEVLGQAPGEQISGSTLLSLMHPDDRQAVLRARDEAIHGNGEINCEFRMPQPDGDVRWIAAKGRVEEIAASSTSPRLLRGVIHDVTERRQAEDRFRLVIDNAPTAMLMVDDDRYVSMANTQAERVFGYTRAELIGQRLDILMPVRSRLNYLAPRAGLAKPQPMRSAARLRELSARRKDGVKIRVEVGLTPIRIENDRFVLVSVTDISERIRLEKETALQREELAHLSRVTLLGEMSGSLAHELNQPLTAVLSNAQAALRFLEHDPPNLQEVHESLVHIVESDKRASEVIRRLRALLRKERVNFQRLSINEVVQDVLRLINSDVLNRNVALTDDLHPDLPTVDGDRVQLQQVLLNLIINACDAMEGMAIGRTLTVCTQLMPGPAVQVSVNDVGRGVPVDEIERIFAPFVTSKVHGIGLGLPICRTIIQAHRGTLWATNNAAGGATLHFLLPASGTDAAPADA